LGMPHDTGETPALLGGQCQLRPFFASHFCYAGRTWTLPPMSSIADMVVVAATSRLLRIPALALTQAAG
jgi:hypothetical protein